MSVKVPTVPAPNVAARARRSAATRAVSSGLRELRRSTSRPMDAATSRRCADRAATLARCPSLLTTRDTREDTFHRWVPLTVTVCPSENVTVCAGTLTVGENPMTRVSDPSAA